MDKVATVVRGMQARFAEQLFVLLEDPASRMLPEGLRDLDKWFQDERYCWGFWSARMSSDGDCLPVAKADALLALLTEVVAVDPAGGGQDAERPAGQPTGVWWMPPRA